MLWPGLKKLGKELGLKRIDSEVVGIIKNCFVRMYDGSNIKVLEMCLPELDGNDKENIAEKLKANKIKSYEWLTRGVKITFREIIAPYPIKKIRNLLDQFIDYFWNKYPHQIPPCQQCGEQKESDAYCINNMPVFVCDKCYEKIENDLENENREQQYVEGNYLFGFMGALVFSIPGIMLTIILFVFLNRLAAVSALLYVFLGIKGYKKFRGKTSPFGAFVVIFAALIMVTVGVFLSYSVMILREIGEIDIDLLLLVLKFPEVQREMMINIVLSYLVSSVYFVFQIIQMAKEWKNLKRIYKAKEI